MNLRLLTITCVILCIKLTIQTRPGVKVSLLFLSFKNPNSLDLNGKCCEQTCTRCDYYFEICLKDGTNNNCLLDVTTKVWKDTTDIVFPRGNGALGNSHNNPLVKELPSWKGKLVVSITVKDDDLTWDDLVDRISINKPVTPTAGIAQQTWTTITKTGIPSTIKLQYSVQCNRDYYGPSCTKYCKAHDDSQGHYTCDLKTGEKVCRNDWYGKDCLTNCVPKDDDNYGHYTCEKNTGKKVCINGWYGTSCKTYCMAHNDSSAGYSCDSTGNKICLTNWYPSNQCDVFCVPRNDSTSGFTCDLTTGQKTCLTGWYGPECDCSPRNDSNTGFVCNTTTGQRLCHAGWYGSHCNVFCTPRNDLGGHYSCNSNNGARECLKNWFGKNCDIYCPPSNETSSAQNTMCSVNNTIICARNWYGANCSVHCEPRDDDEAHYKCNQQTGQKICLQGWHGGNCSIYCTPRDNDWFGHYKCDLNGNKICHESWYGPDCKLYCKPQNSSILGYYLCKGDGTRACLENWYGTKCLRYCKGQDNDQGHYQCSAAGDIVCLENWYAENCTVHCVPRDDPQGHYTCDPLTGQEVCMAGWTGTNCKDEVLTEPTIPGSGTQQPAKDKGSKQARTDTTLSETSLALILGGFLLLICVTVGVTIIICSRRQTKRPGKPFPYLRYKNSSTACSLERAADIVRDPKEPEPDPQLNRQSRIPNLLSQYDDSASKEQQDNVVINLQEISWNQDGSRNVDEKLVMYNNPLFLERQNLTTDPHPAPDPRVDPATGLRDNSDWVAIFDSYDSIRLVFK